MDLGLLVRRMFAGANEAVIFTDRQGTILEVNQAFSDLYQYSREEVVGQNPRILSLGQTSRELYREMWKNILDPQIGYWKGELTNKKKDGTPVPILNYITTVRDEEGQIGNFMGLAIDLTEQKRLENEQREQQLRLAYIGEAAAAIAHDINNPLNVIIGHALIGLRKPGDEQNRKRLETIRAQGFRIALMTTEITDTVKGKYNLSRSEVKVEEFIDSLVQDLEQRPFLHGIRIGKTCDYAGPVQMGYDRMYRAVENLVKNAAEALNERPSDSKEISISVREENGYAVIGIHDNGPGVSAEIEPRLFQIYATSGKGGKGTGIGLNNVKKLAEAHGGTVRYERKDNISSFYLSLPINRDL